ncbi:leucyl aminopeptidase family protein [Algoriphagus lacus]|uniref:Leucyl aminopeptidase family protein n=1 Tax=Algoriphagus lacus TaxID=2056311 RepID=A0A418PMZ5_9BACT|nr:leucyl aminopeptidase family protein [Algoriphagus lacus]RIW12731.1 leucyl aminopeptidase family protein [Algoriphagus lacus]
MQFKINPKNPSGTALRVIPVFEDHSEKILKEKLKNSGLPKTLFSGKKDSSYILEAENQLVLLLGLGENPEYKTIENSFRRVLSKNSSLLESEVILDFPDSFSHEQVEAALIGFQLGGYSIGFYKKEKPKDFNKLKVEVRSEAKKIKSLAERAEKIAAAKIEAFKLVDLPPNKITPENLGDWAKNLSKKVNVSVKVFDSKKAKSEGLEAFLAVGRGSAKDPKFIILEYRHPKAKFHLGLVGKGVTFDTGGLNVKTQGMHHMKSDMGGAAAVLATTQLIADLDLPINLTSIVPAVENAIDKDAYLPSEVIGSHAGLSIEVIDTDAEGRLILADGLSYLIKNYKADQVIDLATLTGSAIGTFGYECAALFSNDGALSHGLQQAGEDVGEKSWPLPLWENYGKEMDSEIADIKNYHGKPFAGAITAAKFLEAFIHEHKAWAHLDIAGVAFSDTEFSKTKTGTAYGVSLLLKFIENQLQ